MDKDLPSGQTAEQKSAIGKLLRFCGLLLS
jgi:hypothetical protein